MNPPTNISYPPSVYEYNDNFTKCLDKIKRRHDPTVTTVAQGILDWKRSRNVSSIGTDVQGWLDRFYMSRIGIRFLIGQRESFLFIFGCWLVSWRWMCLTNEYLSVDIALNTLQSHEDYVGIICTRSVSLLRPRKLSGLSLTILDC